MPVLKRDSQLEENNLLKVFINTKKIGCKNRSAVRHLDAKDRQDIHAVTV